MRLLEPLTLDDAILSALRAELGYSIRREDLRDVDPDSVEAMSPEERRALLIRDPRWLDEVLDPDTRWHRAVLTVEELDDLFYVHDEPWISFTARSCAVRDGDASLDALAIETRTRVEWSIHRLHEGAPVAPLILVSDREGGRTAVISGDDRVTACARLCARDRELDAILGLNPRIAKWPWMPA